MTSFDGCDLHIPHKEWASPEERQNYLAIERWASHYKRDCLPLPGRGISFTVHQRHYYTLGLSPPYPLDPGTTNIEFDQLRVDPAADINGATGFSEDVVSGGAGIKILDEGFFSWVSEVDLQSFGTAPQYASVYQQVDSGGIVSYERHPLPTILNTSGGVYTRKNGEYYMQVEHNGSTSTTMQLRHTVTLLSGIQLA